MLTLRGHSSIYLSHTTLNVASATIVLPTLVRFLLVSSDRVVVSRGPDMQVDATRADAGTAAARLLKTALQQSIKSTSEAPKAVPKPLKTVQGPPPEFKPRKDINMGYSIGESSVPPLKG